jgi:hypothetical protein
LRPAAATGIKIEETVYQSSEGESRFRTTGMQ